MQCVHGFVSPLFFYEAVSCEHVSSRELLWLAEILPVPFARLFIPRSKLPWMLTDPGGTNGAILGAFTTYLEVSTIRFFGGAYCKCAGDRSLEALLERKVDRGDRKGQARSC